MTRTRGSRNWVGYTGDTELHLPTQYLERLSFAPTLPHTTSDDHEYVLAVDGKWERLVTD